MPVIPRPAVAGCLVALALAGCAPSPPADDPTTSSAPAVLPKVTPPPSVAVTPAPGPSGPRPENGAVVVARGGSGSGLLSVDNATDLDAVVTLALDGLATRAVYVRAAGHADLRDVADGTYAVFVAQGDGWNRELRRFTDGPEYAKFADPAPFTTERDAGGLAYTQLRLTLRPVGSGASGTVGVDADAVPQ